jgi:hypothetical protein
MIILQLFWKLNLFSSDMVDWSCGAPLEVVESLFIPDNPVFSEFDFSFDEPEKSELTRSFQKELELFRTGSMKKFVDGCGKHESSEMNSDFNNSNMNDQVRWLN